MNLKGARVAIIGDGIVGLSTALECVEAGAEVQIYSATAGREMRPEDASDKACSMWYPVLLGGNAGQVDEWASYTYERLTGFEKLRGSGVAAVSDVELIDDAKEFESPPAALSRLFDFRASRGEGPVPPGVIGTWRFTTYVMTMPTYLAFVRQQLREHGVVFTQQHFSSLEQILDTVAAPIIFNCTGLGARSLLDDESVEGVKGHLLFFDPVDFPYCIGRFDFAIMPRPDGLVLGALFIQRPESLEPLPEERDQILTEIRAWQKINLLGLGLPELNLDVANIRREITGLRPYRKDGVRLAAQEFPNSLVIHNYGHGGSGATVSWGCAREAVRLAAQYR